MIRRSLLLVAALVPVVGLLPSASAVTWKWETTSTRPHNVEDDKGAYNSHPGCGGPGFYGLGTGLAQCGFTGATSFEQVFRKPGTYRYHCAIHGSPGSGMAGTVVVKAAPAPAKKR